MDVPSSVLRCMYESLKCQDWRLQEATASEMDEQEARLILHQSPCLAARMVHRHYKSYAHAATAHSTREFELEKHVLSANARGLGPSACHLGTGTRGRRRWFRRGPGGDCVRRLHRGHREQQLHPDRSQGQLPSVRAGLRRRRRHRPLLQRPPPRRLRLRGARPAALRAGVPRPRPHHTPSRLGRQLRLRRLRAGQHNRANPGNHACMHTYNHNFFLRVPQKKKN